MKKILITGSSGFIGSHLLDDLLAKNNEILCISRQESLIKKKVLYIKSDLDLIDRDVNAIKEFKPEIVFHLAWEGIPNFSSINSTRNILISIKFLSIINQIKSVKKIIITGTCLEYEKYDGECNEDENVNPTSWLAFSKKYIYEYSRKLFLENNKDLFWIRLFYVYGPKQRDDSLMPYIIRNLKNNKKPIIKNLNSSNDFIYISDVINGLSSLVTINAQPGIYNFGSGYLTSVAQILNQLQKNMIDKNLTKLRLDPFQKYVETSKGFYANNNKAINQLNWHPEINIKLGLKNIIEFYE